MRSSTLAPKSTCSPTDPSNNEVGSRGSGEASAVGGLKSGAGFAVLPCAGRTIYNATPVKPAITVPVISEDNRGGLEEGQTVVGLKSGADPNMFLYVAGTASDDPSSKLLQWPSSPDFMKVQLDIEASFGQTDDYGYGICGEARGTWAEAEVTALDEPQF